MPPAGTSRGRAAVTGASGFIGSHVVTALDAAGWRLRLLARREPPTIRASQVPELVIGDLADDEALETLVQDCDLVVHAAGLVKARSRTEFFRVNAEATARLVAIAARRPSPPRFLLVSSIAACEPNLSSYCASRRAAEDALNREARDMRWGILRPVAVYGPHDREFLPFFRCVARGLAPRPAGIEPRLSMIFVRDLADLIVVVAEDQDSHGICWEADDGTPRGHSWVDLAAAAASALGTRPLSVAVGRWLLGLIAGGNDLATACDGRARMFTREKLRELWHPDWGAAHRPASGTKWQPRWDLTHGFAETAAWYRLNGWL